MLHFRDITFHDKTWIQTALSQSGFIGCEYSFANNLAWHRAANSRIAQLEGFYLIAAFDTPDGVPCFSFPAGKGDYQKLLAAMAEFAAQQHFPLVISGITTQSRPLLEQAAPPDCFTWQDDRDGWDYIYHTQDIIHYPGKKFHQKRNHVNRFAAYHGEFSEITEQDFDECIAFAAKSYNEKDGYTERSSVVEQYAIHTYFSHFRELGLSGGLIRINGQLAAFSIGEPLNQETFCVHIEKADTRFHGAFPAIAQQFAAHFAAAYPYLNREEDLGIQGLRKSKLSYHPAFLLEKQTAVCAEPKKLLEGVNL